MDTPVVPTNPARAPNTRRATVPPLVPMESEDEANATPEASHGQGTPIPNPETQVRRSNVRGRRRRDRPLKTQQEEQPNDVWGSLEGQILRVQRLRNNFV